MMNPMRCLVLVAAMLGEMAVGGNLPLNQVESWLPMGEVPVTANWDGCEQAIRFVAERGKAKSCRIWPLYQVRDKEALRNVSAIRFEMKYHLYCGTLHQLPYLDEVPLLLSHEILP